LYIAERRVSTTEAILRDAGIPARHARCDFDGFERRDGTEAAFKAALAWAQGFTLQTEIGLLLAGDFGSGKTHLATAALRHVVQESLVESMMVDAADLVPKVRGGPHANWQSVERAETVELLLLDDLGHGVATDFDRTVIARVVRARYVDELPTLITSNLGPAGLSEALGGSVASRIRQMVTCAVTQASDYRTQ